MSSTKAGSRHSKTDMELGRSARSAAKQIDQILVDLGFADEGDEDAAAKALNAVRALKAQTHNAQDVAFATQMIPHHQAAIDMANKQVADGTNADLMNLAKAIIAAQTDEIEVLRAWLDAAGEDAQAADDAPMPMKTGASADLRAKAFGATVKKVGDYTLKGVGVCYGGKDLYEDTFTAATDFGQERSFVGMPVFYDHALGSVKSQVGTVKAWEATDDGIVFEVELDKHKSYVTDILKLAEKGALGFSTGALSHTVVREGGELKRWTIGEISLTPTPAEPRTLGVQPTKAISTGKPEANAEAGNRAGAAHTVTVLRIIR